MKAALPRLLEKFWEEDCSLAPFPFAFTNYYVEERSEARPCVHWYATSVSSRAKKSWT